MEFRANDSELVEDFHRQGFGRARCLFDEREVELLREVTAAEVVRAADAWKRKDTEGHTTRLSVRNELEATSTVRSCDAVGSSA